MSPHFTIGIPFLCAVHGFIFCNGLYAANRQKAKVYVAPDIFNDSLNYSGVLVAILILNTSKIAKWNI